MSRLRLLAILLCYNDGDILADSIRTLLEQNHHIILWNHGSDDSTASVIEQFRSELLESRYIARDFDFYEMYPAMSRHLIETYANQYDWISWPDQDEYLEGPDRKRPYDSYLEEVYESSYNWIQFNNYNYWHTAADDHSVASPIERIRHYSLFPDCAPRIRSWRASATNMRIFNHNPPHGDRFPRLFNLRHYPMRSAEQMMARILRDRAGLRRGDSNYHYENMRINLTRLQISPNDLHYDDRTSDLNPAPIFNWRSIYGWGPLREDEEAGNSDK